MWKLEAAWVPRCWNRNTMLSYLFQKEVGERPYKSERPTQKKNKRTEGRGRGCTGLADGCRDERRTGRGRGWGTRRSVSGKGTG